jgi:hypothetical protein
MTVLASNMTTFYLVDHGMRQIRIRCGWKYNRTVYFDQRYILFEVTKCCDHCKHCVKREQAVELALMVHGAQYEFSTNVCTLTRWVTIERLTDQDPVTYLREVTGLPIERVYFEIRRAMRKKLDWIATGLLALCFLIAGGYVVWQLGARLIAYLFQ